MSQVTAAGKRISDILLSLCSYYMVNSIVITIGFTYLESKTQILQQTVAGISAKTILEAIVRMIAFGLAGLVVLPRYRKELINRKQNGKQQMNFKTGLLLIAAGGVLAIVLNQLWGLLPFFANNEAYRNVAKSQHAYPLWLALPLYGVFSPMAEEILFRGILLSGIRDLMGAKMGVILSALLFGLVHGNPVQASYGMVMGIFLGILANKYEGLTAVFLFHSAANIAVCVGQYL